MIILIVAQDLSLRERISSHFGPKGYEVVQYNHPLKAMDNLEEISPEILICHAADYPRHWKLLVKQIRDAGKRDDAAVVIVVGSGFQAEEADKAAFLGVNILYSGSMDTAGEMRELERRIIRYKSPPAAPGGQTWVPGENERLSFLFRHPGELRMIAGRLTDLSPTGGTFRADDATDIADLTEGDIIDDASMRAGEALVTLRCRVVGNTGTLSLAFLDFRGDGFRDFMEEIRHRVSRL